MAVSDYDNVLKEQYEQMKEQISKKGKNLSKETEDFFNKWSANRPKKVDVLEKDSIKETAANIKEWRNKWENIEEKIKTILNDCEHFGVETPKLAFYEECKKDLIEEEENWKVYDEYSLELESFEKDSWATFRNKQFNFQDFVLKWAEKLKKETAIRKTPVGLYLAKQMNTYKELFPALKLLVGDAFDKEHWMTLFTMLKMPKSIKFENLTLGDLLDAEKEILLKLNEIKELAARAQGEISLKEAVYELRLWCETTEFQLTEYTSEGRTTPLIKEWRDLMTRVSDNQALMASLKESKFISRFSDQIESFAGKFAGLDELLGKLNIIQRKWVYLEPIFTRGALPQEQGRFKNLEEEFRGIMLNIQRDPKVIGGFASIPGIRDTLEMILDQLERCQKALNDFLEEKRGKFPRFYFLGDDDLLEILGQSKNPLVIQMHLKKLFAGIFAVEFVNNNEKISAMKSAANEVVSFKEKILVEEEVEIWLSNLSSNMKETLKTLLLNCLKENSLEIQKYPSQVLCLAEGIKFTDFCINSINSGKLLDYKKDLSDRLQKFTNLSGENSNPLIQLKLKALILDLIHYIDIIDNLINNSVDSLKDWAFYKQLRYEISKKKNNAEVIMCSARFDYTYEYQGNATKLVHTPLTDKCYLTLTQGMYLGFGGNPYGPAGTGKTESVKALGNFFGRQVLVFNCDEGIDFKSMGRIFIGLIKCGAWGCFDEFNRLLEEQLSAISQQIQIIQWAIKEKQNTLELLGKTIEVNKNAGIFVTMNPAGKGYGGRSKLPDNLKQLFRPVAMSVPDNELIAEVLLFAEGFRTAKELSKKIVTIFLLSKQLLSAQQHYDWGLRALKTILNVAGQLIQDARVYS